MEHVKTDLTVFIAMEYPEAIPDDRDLKLAQEAYKRYHANPSPQVGDYVVIDGKYYRFSYDWGDSIQYSTGGSWHLTVSGISSFSGGLEPSIPKAKLTPVTETKNAVFWMWHHDVARCHNGIYVIMPVRVFEYCT